MAASTAPDAQDDGHFRLNDNLSDTQVRNLARMMHRLDTRMAFACGMVNVRIGLSQAALAMQAIAKDEPDLDPSSAHPSELRAYLERHGVKI